MLYWIQQSQRAEHNPALEHAARRANQHGKPLLVGFGLMDDYPEANARHYRFMLRGLAETHDPYWNAAMQEMTHTGYMHNHMRMYWGKKILEWTNTPEYAFRTALYLNNKYHLDGRDSNSYAGVAWVFCNHDRGWTEREVFGKVRYMNAAGLGRKCDIDAYVEKVQTMTGSRSSSG